MKKNKKTKDCTKMDFVGNLNYMSLFVKYDLKFFEIRFL